MPSYDATCATCGHEDIVSIKIADLTGWDHTAICPHCQAGNGSFHRIIKQAVLINVGDKSRQRSALSKKNTPLKPSIKEDMQHQMWRKQDKNQMAEAREIVKSGKYEGF